MKDPRRCPPRPHEYTGCFGRFRPEDRICRNHCAICIRCAIETEHDARMAMLEDYFEEEDILLNIQ